MSIISILPSEGHIFNFLKFSLFIIFFIPGIPSTLNVIDLNDQQLPIENRPLRPYPSLALNQLHPNLQPDPNRIVTVYRPRIDRCDRLWFVDTGMMEFPSKMPIYVLLSKFHFFLNISQTTLKLSNVPQFGLLT